MPNGLFVLFCFVCLFVCLFVCFLCSSELNTCPTPHFPAHLQCSPFSDPLMKACATFQYNSTPLIMGTIMYHTLLCCTYWYKEALSSLYHKKYTKVLSAKRYEYKYQNIVKNKLQSILSGILPLFPLLF